MLPVLSDRRFRQIQTQPAEKLAEAAEAQAVRMKRVATIYRSMREELYRDLQLEFSTDLET